MAQPIQGLSPTLHTKSTKDTGYKACHSPTSCVFCWEEARGAGGARPDRKSGAHGRTDGGRARDGDRLAVPHPYAKTLWAGAYAPAHSRLIKTPVLTRTQLSSRSRPNLRSHQLSELRYLRCSPHRPGSNRKPYATSGRWPRSGGPLPRRAVP